MTTYRPGRSWRVTIVGDPGPQPCEQVGPHYCFTMGENTEHQTARLHAVVMAGKVLTTDPELAERVCALLNGQPPHAIAPEIFYAQGAAEALALVAERVADAADRGPDSRMVALGAVRLILEGVAAELGVDETAPPSPLSAPVSASTPPVVAKQANGSPEAAETISELRALLAAYVDDEPCHYDHHGDCQAHLAMHEGRCANAAAKELLTSEPHPRPIRPPSRDDQERADVHRRITQHAEHRPSSLGGDGLGYGPCVGCAKLWPCPTSRDERKADQAYTCPDHPGPLDDPTGHVCRLRPARYERTTP